jgi:hypothetical protein
VTYLGPSMVRRSGNGFAEEIMRVKENDSAVDSV